MEKSVGVYYRVSTASQDLENQQVSVSQWCKANGIASTSVEVYSDIVSGATFDVRPNLTRLKDDIKAGQIKKVIVWRLDRLGRSLQHLIKLVNLFQTYKVDFVSIIEGFDTGSASGRLMFHVLGAMAEFERNLISERARLVVMKKKAMGISFSKRAQDLRKRKTSGYHERFRRERKEKLEALIASNLPHEQALIKKLQAQVKKDERYRTKVRYPNLPQGAEDNG